MRVPANIPALKPNDAGEDRVLTLDLLRRCFVCSHKLGILTTQAPVYLRGGGGTASMIVVGCS
jgi:hypothetical protein